MDHIVSVRAALRASAPIVAIPIEGHAPLCLKRKLLAAVLKGVTILSVEVIVSGLTRSLKVTGRAGECTRTSCTLVAMSRYQALRGIRDWTDRERDKRRKIIAQGVLSAPEQRALKMAAMEKAEAKELANQLESAKAEYAHIRDRVRDHVSSQRPVMYDHERKPYLVYHRTRHLRKRASVIRYQIAELRKQADRMTVKGNPRRNVKASLRRGKNAGDLLCILAQIGALEAEFKTLFPSVWVPNQYSRFGGSWDDSFIPKHPKELTRKQTYRSEYDREEIARRLMEAKQTILALTPPKDEDSEEMPIAA